MNYTEAKRILLQIFICFLALTALIAIASVLTGEFGEIQAKILGTSFTISAASICSMSCAAFVEKNKNLAHLGLSGIALSILTAILVIIGIWAEIDSDIYIKTVGTCCVCSIASAHACLLVLPSLQRNHAWVQTTSTASIAVLSLQIVVAIWAEIDAENYYRLLAVVAILVGLETLVIPILMKLQGKQRAPEPASIHPSEPQELESVNAGETLDLRRVTSDVYSDSDGRRYRVRPLEESSPESEINPGQSQI